MNIGGIQPQNPASGIQTKPPVELTKKPKALLEEGKKGLINNMAEGYMDKFVDGNRVKAKIDGPEIFDNAKKMIREAKDDILLEMYDFSDMEMAEVLASQVKKGIDVKVLLEPQMVKGTRVSEDRQKVFDYLKNNGVKVLTYPSEHSNQIDHVKLLIVDGKKAMLGGMNWNPASKNNHDANVEISGPAVQYYKEHFADGWNVSGGGEIDLTPAEFGRNPGSSKVKGFRTNGSGDVTAAQTTLMAVNNAKKSIYLEMYMLSDQEMIDSLVAAHNRKVDVRVILDPNQAYTGWSPNDKTFKQLKQAGVPVRWYKVDKNQRAHGKWAVVDGEELMIGSPNWSNKAFTINREVGAHVFDEEAADVFTKQFQYDWQYKASEDYTM